MQSAPRFLAAIAALAALLATLVAAAPRGNSPGRAASRELAAALDLTDLALWTEARYTRHPSQADFFAPFQDAPGAPEHFPAGSVMSPAPGSRAGGGPIVVRRRAPAPTQPPGPR